MMSPSTAGLHSGTNSKSKYMWQGCPSLTTCSQQHCTFEDLGHSLHCHLHHMQLRYQYSSWHWLTIRRHGMTATASHDCDWEPRACLIDMPSCNGPFGHLCPKVVVSGAHKLSIVAVSALGLLTEHLQQQQTPSIQPTCIYLSSAVAQIGMLAEILVHPRIQQANFFEFDAWGTLMGPEVKFSDPLEETSCCWHRVASSPACDCPL